MADHVRHVRRCASGPAPVKVKGAVEVDYSSDGSDPYSSGTQVVVCSSDNDVIATGSLVTSVDADHGSALRAHPVNAGVSGEDLVIDLALHTLIGHHPVHEPQAAQRFRVGE
jgi:hypothetical protein